MDLPPEIELLTTCTVSKADREAFRTGPLRESWANCYHQLFDELNLKAARNMPNKYFYEWEAARYLFDDTAHLSLVHAGLNGPNVQWPPHLNDDPGGSSHAWT